MTLNVEALNEVGRIFDWRPDPARYFASAAIEQVRHALLANLLHSTTSDRPADGHGVLVLTGESGAGKTLLVGTVVQNLPAHWWHVAQLSFTVMSGQEIASAIAYAFGMPPGPSVMSHQSPRDWIETQLRVWASCDEASLLVVDEAQNLPPDALHTLLDLNQLRLNDRPVLRVLLVGQPEFLQRLTEASLPAELKPHAGDIGPAFFVPALKPEESAAYLQHQLAQYAGPALPTLTPSAYAEIHARTQGRPGRINVLCQQLLHSAILLESQEPIDAAAVAIQADELLYHAAPGVPPSAPQAATPAAVQPVEVVEVVEAPKVARAAAPPTETLASPTLAPRAPTPPPPTAQHTPPMHPVRVRPPQPANSPPIRRLAAWSTSLVAIALVAGLTWFYAPHPGAPTTDVVAAKAPHAASPAPAQTPIPAPGPVSTPAPPAIEEPIATETTDTPDPQTEALLSEHAASAALSAPTPALPLPKELPHAPPIRTLPPAKPAPAARPATAAAASTPARSADQTANARCNNLLAQISLGEPVTAKQRRALETQCRLTP